MGIPNKPTSIAGDGLHYGPGTLRTAQQTAGPARQIPSINTAAQSGRASQVSRGNVSPDLNSREIARTELGNPDYYGMGD